MTRRLRVSRLNANRSASCPVRRSIVSNHSRLACAARWVDSTTGRRSASYAANACSTVGCSPRLAARARASSRASLVPEPIEKCAECAASPSSTTFRCRQVALRTVVKRIQREALGISRCPSRCGASSSAQRRTLSSSLSPRANSRSARASKPARRQASSAISTMKVDRCALYG